MFLRKFFIILFFISCAAPQEINNSQYLPQGEYLTISGLKKAKDYLQRGKLDLAEAEYRKVLNSNPKLTLAYNDLGVIYEQTDRVDLAKKLFQKSFNLDNKNFVALKNLAKLNFRAGETQEALLQLEETLSLVNSLNNQALKKISGKDWNDNDLEDIYALIVLANLDLGDFDEAICNSYFLVNRSPKSAYFLQHERLLSALDRVEEASKFLSSRVQVQSETPAELFFDYAVISYSINDLKRTEQMIELTKISNSFNTVDKFNYEMFSLLLMAKQQQKAEFLEKKSELFEEYPEICKRDLDIPYYTPSRVAREMGQLLKNICSDERD